MSNPAKGFVYAVARKGVTGGKTNFSNDVRVYLSNLKKITDLPVAVGFGVSSKEDIESLKEVAQMAVIGSAVMKSYLEKGQTGVADFFKSIH